MPKSITLSDDLFDRLAALARPFIDKEPADVVRWLVDDQSKDPANSTVPTPKKPGGAAAISGRVPRERGAVVEIDGTTIQADSVPDLCAKIMELLFETGKWSKVLDMAPYKTSAQRYLFSKTPKHPNGNDFWVEVKCRGLYVEAHKNYKTAIEQLSRLVAKCGMALTYKGT